jgi:catechol 2,3-dioxygenase-like lactoylglutathione lyase family enzyme
MSGSILGTSKLVAFAPVTDFEKACAFYEGVLGLRLVSEEKPFALVFDANGTMLRVTPVGAQHNPAPFTILGWHVESISETVAKLNTAGVKLLHFPWFGDTAPNDIWNAPGGAKVAWFNDPDGNVLSVTEF